MAFDYKKEYKEFYIPKNKPSILTVPAMNYIAVRGHGDPNQEDGEYKQAIWRRRCSALPSICCRWRICGRCLRTAIFN